MYILNTVVVSNQENLLQLYLPFPSWGFAYFGSRRLQVAAGTLGRESMAQQEKTIAINSLLYCTVSGRPGYISSCWGALNPILQHENTMKNPQSWLPLTSHILVQSTVAKFCKNVHLCNDHLPNAAILRLRNTWLANCVEIEFPPNLHTAPWNIHYHALLLLLFRSFWWQNGWLTANNWRRWSSISKWSPAWPRTMHWEGRSNQRSHRNT